MHAARHLTATCLLVASGCGSTSVSPVDARLVVDGSLRDTAAAAAPGDDGSVGFPAGDDGSAAMAVDGGCPATTPVCPATAPAQGDPCTAPFGFHCEYGDDPLAYCDTDAWCEPGHGWVVALPIPPDDAASPPALCPTMPPSSCPATFMAATSAPVACGGNYQCVYPEGTCDCALSGFGAAMLTCSPPSTPNCPVTRPRAGTPCSTEAGLCARWGDGCGVSIASMECTCGSWQPLSCIRL